jgi:hypothetical protein
MFVAILKYLVAFDKDGSPIFSLAPDRQGGGSTPNNAY